MSEVSQASSSSPLKRKLSESSFPPASPTRRRKVHTPSPKRTPKLSCIDSTGDDLPPLPSFDQVQSISSEDANVAGIKSAGERTDRDTACWQSWESNFEDIRDASRAHDELKANLDIRRSLQIRTATVAGIAAEVATLVDGRSGLKELQQHLEDVHASEELYDDLIVVQLESEIREIQSTIRLKQDEQDDETVRFNSEAASLSRHLRAVYPIVVGLNIKRFVVFRKFPDTFFVDFARCQDLDLQRRDIDEELTASRLEVDARQDEIHAIVVQINQARGINLSADAEKALFALEDERDELIAAPDLLDLEKSCDDWAEQLDGIEKQLNPLEVRLYDTVEEHLVAEGLIEAVVSSESPDADEIPEVARACKEPCSTPLAETDMRYFNLDRTCRLLHRRLQKALHQRYNASVRLMEQSQSRLESLRLLSDLTSEERALADSADHAFFLAKAQRTRAVVEAEQTSLEILSSAQDAGVLGVPAKSEGFSDHASDGYATGTVNAHVARTNLDCVQQWVDSEQSAKSKVDYANGDVVQMESPDEPEVGERPALQPLDIGESFSTVATGKEKGRIDGWLAVKKAHIVSEKDVFKRDGRRMSV